jgi:parallel beta-helix repeat protein
VGINTAWILRSPEGVIADNVISRTRRGIWLQSGDAGFEVHDNRVSESRHGIIVSSSGNTIHDNDFRGNLGPDCIDSTTGSGSAGTSNIWTNNLGDDSAPVGICAGSLGGLIPRPPPDS